MLRYSLLYFGLLLLFLIILIAPSVAGKYVPSSIDSMLSSTNLIQPTGQDNNDTIGRSATGTGAADYSGAMLTMTQSSAAASATTAAAKVKLF